MAIGQEKIGSKLRIPSAFALFLTAVPCANCKTTKKNQFFVPKTIAQVCRLTVRFYELVDRRSGGHARALLEE